MTARANPKSASSLSAPVRRANPSEVEPAGGWADSNRSITAMVPIIATAAA